MASKRCTRAVNASSTERPRPSLRLEHHRLDRMWPRAELDRRRADHEEVLPTTRCRVHDDDRHRAVFVDEGRAEQHAAARRREDSPGTGTDELREVAYVVVRIGVDELAGPRVGMDRCEAEIPHMVRAAPFIEQNVP